jgi:hypothetical protein
MDDETLTNPAAHDPAIEQAAQAALGNPAPITAEQKLDDLVNRVATLETKFGPVLEQGGLVTASQLDTLTAAVTLIKAALAELKIFLP